jgi:SAM-dependent methyltransferase
LADDNSPAFLPGAFQAAYGAIQAKDQLEERFKTGKGMGWHEHSANVFVGTERFFRPGYAANLLSAWIPALVGVDAKLKAGARVADVGCGLGASTILMAKHYPMSQFVGFDYHGKSIETAKERAKDAGVADRIIFEVAMAKTYPGRDYDLVTFFDCLHDMGDPAGASEHVHSSLEKDGTWMIVEPFARTDRRPESIGRAFWRIHAALHRHRFRRSGFGAGARRRRLRDRSLGGFTRFRRATQTPFSSLGSTAESAIPRLRSDFFFVVGGLQDGHLMQDPSPCERTPARISGEFPAAAILARKHGFVFRKILHKLGGHAL